MSRGLRLVSVAAVGPTLYGVDREGRMYVRDDATPPRWTFVPTVEGPSERCTKPLANGKRCVWAAGHRGDHAATEYRPDAPSATCRKCKAKVTLRMHGKPHDMCGKCWDVNTSGAANVGRP